jgi:hypothetical protein
MSFCISLIRLLVLFAPLACCALGTPLTAQTPAVAANTPMSDPKSMPAATTPSTILRPAMEVLEQAIVETDVDRWKSVGAVREEAQTNLHSIQRDIETTLPPLLAAADAAPGSAAKTLAAYRNIEALYDVVLRLEAAGQLSAPRDQASALAQALAGLNDSRNALGDQLQQEAVAQETQVGRLQAALKAVPIPPPPTAPVVCSSSTTPKKKTARPAARPPSTAAQSPPTTSQ